MELYDINYFITYRDVSDKLIDCLWRCMRLITRLLMEMYDINYLIAYGDVRD